MANGRETRRSARCEARAWPGVVEGMRPGSLVG